MSHQKIIERIRNVENYTGVGSDNTSGNTLLDDIKEVLKEDRNNNITNPVEMNNYLYDLVEKGRCYVIEDLIPDLVNSTRSSYSNMYYLFKDFNCYSKYIEKYGDIIIDELNGNSRYIRLRNNSYGGSFKKSDLTSTIGRRGDGTILNKYQYEFGSATYELDPSILLRLYVIYMILAERVDRYIKTNHAYLWYRIYNCKFSIPSSINISYNDNSKYYYFSDKMVSFDRIFLNPNNYSDYRKLKENFESPNASTNGTGSSLKTVYNYYIRNIIGSVMENNNMFLLDINSSGDIAIGNYICYDSQNYYSSANIGLSDSNLFIRRDSAYVYNNNNDSIGFTRLKEFNNHHNCYNGFNSFKSLVKGYENNKYDFLANIEYSYNGIRIDRYNGRDTSDKFIHFSQIMTLPQVCIREIPDTHFSKYLVFLEDDKTPEDIKVASYYLNNSIEPTLIDNIRPTNIKQLTLDEFLNYEYNKYQFH